MPKTPKNAKPAKKSPARAKAAPPSRAKSATKKPKTKTTVTRTKAVTNKAVDIDAAIHQTFISSLTTLLSHWENKTAALQKQLEKSTAKGNKKTASSEDSLNAFSLAQSNVNKYRLLKQMVDEFELNWQSKGETGQLKKDNAPAAKKDKESKATDWEREEEETIDEYEEDEMNENLDDIFLPLDEDELSFEGDDYSSDLMDEDS